MYNFIRKLVGLPPIEPSLPADATDIHKFEFSLGGLPVPRWYSYFSPIYWCTVVIGIYLLIRSTGHTLADSSGVAYYLLLIAVAPWAPFRILAYIQAKRNFWYRLNLEERASYKKMYKKHYGHLGKVLIIAIFVLLVFVPLLLYIDHVRNG